MIEIVYCTTQCCSRPHSHMLQYIQLSKASFALLPRPPPPPPYLIHVKCTHPLCIVELTADSAKISAELIHPFVVVYHALTVQRYQTKLWCDQVVQNYTYKHEITARTVFEVNVYIGCATNITLISPCMYMESTYCKSLISCISHMFPTTLVDVLHTFNMLLILQLISKTF